MRECSLNHRKSTDRLYKVFFLTIGYHYLLIIRRVITDKNRKVYIGYIILNNIYMFLLSCLNGLINFTSPNSSVAFFASPFINTNIF